MHAIRLTLAFLLVFPSLLFPQSTPGFRFSPVSANVLAGFFSNFWKLADVNDAIGSATLTNVNTATFSAGQVGDAATFVRTSNQSLTRADAAGLRFGDQKWTLSLWVKRTSTTSVQFFASKENSGNNAGREFIFQGNNGAATVAIAAFNGSGTACALTGSFAMTSNAWHLMVVWFDNTVGADGTLYYSLDGGATQSFAATCTLGTHTQNVSFGGLSGGASSMDGQIDAVGWVQGKTPSAAQIAALYAAGAGWEP